MPVTAGCLGCDFCRVRHYLAQPVMGIVIEIRGASCFGMTYLAGAESK